MFGQQLVRHLVFQIALALPFFTFNNILLHGRTQVSHGLKVSSQVLGKGVIQL